MIFLWCSDLFDKKMGMILSCFTELIFALVPELTCLNKCDKFELFKQVSSFSIIYKAESGENQERKEIHGKV